MTTNDKQNAKGSGNLSRLERAAHILDADLERALLETGILLSGFNFKLRGYDTLLVLKAKAGGVPRVAFVGAKSPTACLSKAFAETRAGKLRWRDDKFASGPLDS